MSNNKKGPESLQHDAAIAAIARETGLEQRLIKELYEREWAELAAHATVRNFISMLAARNVRVALSRQHGTEDSSASMS